MIKSSLSHAAFPLIMAALLAGLTFGLKEHVTEPDTGPPPPLRHEPDAEVTKAEIIRIDDDGVLRYRLVSPFMLHYADDETSFLEKPFIEIFRPDTPTTTMRSDTADVNADASVVVMNNNVVIQRPAGANNPAMRATMATLTIYPDDAKAETNAAVDLRRGESWMKGTGLSIDHDLQRFTLHHHARGSYIKTPGKP